MSLFPGNSIWLRSVHFLKLFGLQRSLLTLCKCSCCRGDLLVNEGHGSGAGGHTSQPALCMRAPQWLPSLRPLNAERAFDCVRANKVWCSKATERSPLGPLRCERWQAAGSKPIELKQHLSDVFDRSVCSADRQISFKETQVLCRWETSPMLYCATSLKINALSGNK